MLESAGISLTETEVSFSNPASSQTFLGLVGTANKGPLNTPTQISSLAEFITVFGKIDEDSYGTYAAYQYLRNGNRLWYVRVGNAAVSPTGTPALAAASASFTNFKLTAASTGSWGNDLSVRFTLTAGSPATDFNVLVYQTNNEGKKVLREQHKGVNLITGSPDFISKRLGSVSGSVLTLGQSTLIAATPVGSTTTRPTATAFDSFLPLSGGQSGLSPSVAEVLGQASNGVTSGIQAFSSLEEVDINLLAAYGFTDPAQVQALINLAEARGDVLVLVDPPQAYTVNQMIEWQLDYTSSRAAVYWPYVQILSPDRAKVVTVPPSVVVAGQMAYNDSVGEQWFAPAGWNRGQITNAVGVEYNTNLSERDSLQSDDNSVNPISFIRNRGVVIWGQKTLAREDALVNRVNIRRLVLYLRRVIGQIASESVFEPNDPTTWLRFKMRVEPVLQAVAAKRGISNYRILSDASTTTQEDIRNNRMNARISIQPVESAEYVYIDFTLTPTGVDFV